MSGYSPPRESNWLGVATDSKQHMSIQQPIMSSNQD